MVIINSPLNLADRISSMESEQSFSDKPKSTRKLYEYCESTQFLNAVNLLDDISNNVKLVSLEDSDYYSAYNDFQFPPPPQHHHILPNGLKMCSEMKNNSQSSSDDADTNSDSSHSDCYPLMAKTQSSKNNAMYKFRGYLSDGSPVSNILNMLPPIGVFWDIENCQVPKGRSAVVIAQAIRDKFFHGYRETEFLVVCDVKKENAQVIQELNDAQVNLIHVSSQSKNAADDKLRQAMRRFADIHGPPAAIMLISGDINFSSDLCDLRHRKKIHVILLHNDLCSQSLILCANENHNYSKLVETLPLRGSENFQSNHPVEVLVTNLPVGYDPAKIRNKLKRLSENCGGRVGIISDTTTTIRFSSMEYAARAQKRMNRERVFGNAVFVSTPYNVIEDQDMFKNPGMKMNLWKSFDNSAQNKDKMYQYQSNGNKMFQHNGNMSTAVDLYSNDSRPPNHSNGIMSNCRNGRGYGYSNVNQENMNSNYSPSWFWNNHKTANENNMKVPRQVLAQCDGNTKCVSNESLNVSSGKPVCSWQFPGQNSMSYYKQQQQQLFDNQPNVTPPVTILKRNMPVPVDPTEVNKLRSRAQTNGPVYKNKTNMTDNSERYFHPISSNQSTSNRENQSTSVELHITNLDQSMDPMELRRCLSKAFGEFTQILHLSVFAQSDGNYAALVKVPSQQDAQFVISKLHHKVKIGFKRIAISYAHSGTPHNIALIRSQTLALLLEVPGHKLPYFKFRELCEKRFKISPSLSDLHKIRDVCVVTEEIHGRCISLVAELRNSPSPMLMNGHDQGSPVEQQYCRNHWKQTSLNDDKGWAELEVSSLPNVKITLQELSKNVHHLIVTHNKFLLLASFCDCYTAECGELTYDDNGVPLEHLVTCVSGVELVTNSGTGIKYLTTSSKNVFDDKKSEGSQSLPDSGSICISPSLANNLALFSRELVDLLKTFPHCMMPFNRFIPAYHHHFGRQCRVADYGYTKLIDLMEALPNVVQVIGDGNRRVMTLAHKAQVRRFTSDLLRVLKSLASKQTTISEFPSLFEKTLNRSFDPIDYGLCNLEDLLSQVSENTIVISTAPGTSDEGDKNTPNVFIAIPKREQTAEEIERTKGFAKEVIELLSHAPQCSMLFNKFIPAYHHHYGHQCKVSDFGFTKLIELFEAIPDIVKIEDDADGGDRRVTLKEDVKLKVLGDQLASLIMAYRPNNLSTDDLSSAFLWQYGYALKPGVYGYKTIEDLIKKLDFAIKIVETASGTKLQAVDKNQLKFLALKTKRVLIERSSTSQMMFKDFAKSFSVMFDESIELETLEKELSDVVTIVKNNNNGDAIIKLTPIELFARDAYFLLMWCDGKLPLNSFENAYLRMYGTAVQPASFGYQTSQALLQAIPQTVVLRGQPPKRIILINVELASVGFPLPKGLTATNSYHNVRESHAQNGNRNPKEGNFRINNKLFEASPLRTPVKSVIADNNNEKISPIILPALTLHPDTYKASPLTSPHKSLHNTIMFAEHMLHAPLSRVEPPMCGQVPFPTFLMENQLSQQHQQPTPPLLEQSYRTRLSVSSQPMTSKEECGEMNGNGLNDDDRRITASVESSTDSFSDGTVSSTNKRKMRLAAHFQGYSDNNNQ